MTPRTPWPLRSILFLLLPAISVALCLPGCGDKSGPASVGNDPAAPAELIGPPAGTAPAIAPTQGTAEDVLKKTIQAYKSAGSYRDAAIVKLAGTKDGQRQEMSYPHAVVMQRPNKLRMQVDGGTLLCDGANTYGFVGELPGQVLKIPAPPQVSIASAYPDFLLAQSMMQSPAQSFCWAPLQLVFLLANDPMKTLALDTQGISLLAPDSIDQFACDRVQLLTNNGPGILWIDQATSVIRRFELPLNALRRQAEADQFLDPTLTVEYVQAELNPPIAPEAFLFQIPAEIKPADVLVPPLLQVLGQPCPNFQFTAIDGTVTPLNSLQGKVVVLQLWSSKAPPCRSVLQAASKTLAGLKDPAQVAMLAVNLEGGNVQNESLQTVLKDWGAELPIYRDPEQSVAKHFGLGGVPVTILLDKKGNIQSLQAGELQNMDALLNMAIERLQKDEDIYKVSFSQFDNQRAQFAMMIGQSITEDIYCLRPMVPRVQISPRTEPANLKMTKLWSCDQLKHPGNITVVSAADGSQKILVIDEAKSIAELKNDGTVAATHPLQLQGNEIVTALRTAVAGDGKRYFLGCARGTQRIHLFDESLKTLLVYPDSLHPGITDAQFADLTGDGKLQMIIGYASVAGVHAVDLQGNRLWADRSMVDAFRVAVLTSGQPGPPSVLAMNGGVGGGTLIQLDSQGKRIREISVADSSVGWVVAEDVDGNGSSDICVLAVATKPDGQAPADTIDSMGIDLGGKVLWRQPTVRGVHYESIEPVVAGNVFPDGPSQWLIAAADGSISIVAADGQLVDRFAYGAELSGLATAKWDGKAVLLVATPKAVEAWQIEPSTPKP